MVCSKTLAPFSKAAKKNNWRRHKSDEVTETDLQNQLMWSNFVCSRSETMQVGWITSQICNLTSFCFVAIWQFAFLIFKRFSQNTCSPMRNIWHVHCSKVSRFNFWSRSVCLCLNLWLRRCKNVYFSTYVRRFFCTEDAHVQVFALM